MLRLGLAIIVGLALAPPAMADLRAWPAPLGSEGRELTLTGAGGGATELVRVVGTPGNDTLRVDFSAGNPAPHGLVFDGGAQAGGVGDSLEIAGGRFESARVDLLPDSPGGGHNGIVDLDGTRIEFRDLEPVTLSAMADLVLVLPPDAADNMAILEDDGTPGNGMSRLRSADDSFEAVTFPNPTGSLTIDTGDDDETLTISNHEVTVDIDVDGGDGDNELTLELGENLNGGDFDGGAGVDTLDHGAATAGVYVNLGANAPGLAAELGGDQENPATSHAATGTATLTYDPLTNTFDISVFVDDLAAADVTGFHLHRGGIGVNGAVIVGFDTGDLVAVGDGFTFDALDVVLDPMQEAALLGGLTYLNVHTSAHPNGAIRGQLFPTGLFVGGTGTATGTGGLLGVENAIGGGGDDSFVGNLDVNVLTGNGGADTLVATRGNDTMDGGADSDIMVWSNGDGTDVMDGQGATDTVQVNGNPTAADTFTLMPGAGGRVAFARSAPGPFSLDIGTTEQLTVGGYGGADTFTASPLTGITPPLVVSFDGFGGDDGFAAPSLAPATARVRGGNGTDSLSTGSGTWTLGPGVGSGSATGLIDGFDQVENLTTGDAADTFTVQDGAGLAGTLDGAGGTDLLDYSAYTTPVAVNLGASVSPLTGSLGGDQEIPPRDVPGTGTLTGTYDGITGTLDLDLTVADLDPATVNGLHLHRAPSNVNGPVAVGLDTSAIVPAGTGFTFQASGLAIPRTDEAALLGGGFYVNVHTTQYPDGAIRGQVYLNALFTASTGHATGFGGLAGVEDATGGQGADGIVGNLGVNVIGGGPGADTLVASRGNDFVVGGGDSDIMVWNNGDGTDVMDGLDGADTVQVNGSPAAADAFVVAPGTGGRVDFDRVSPGPFSLDIDTTENLVVDGIAGDDVLDVFSTSALGGGLEGVGFNGGDGADVIGAPFALPVPVTANGNAGAADRVFVGDFLGVQDGLTAEPGTDGRLRITRQAPAGSPITVGSTEALEVDTGDGSDAVTVTDLAGVRHLGDVKLWGAPGDDAFNLMPATGIPMAVEGNDGSDTLRFDAGCLPVVSTAGSLTADGRAPVTHLTVETVEQASAIWLGATALSVAESAGSVNVPVMRTGTGTATADHATTAGTALAGTDFTAVAGTLSLGSGVTSGGIAVPILDDAAAEAAEQFTVGLVAAGPFAHVCDPKTATVTIDANDPATSAPPTTTPPITVPPGSARSFSIERVKLNRSNGSAGIGLYLPVRGNVSAQARVIGGAAGARASQRRRYVGARGRLRGKGPGPVTLRLKPTKAGRRALRRTGRLRVRMTATFRPSAGGAGQTVRRTITLRLRRR